MYAILNYQDEKLLRQQSKARYFFGLRRQDNEIIKEEIGAILLYSKKCLYIYEIKNEKKFFFACLKSGITPQMTDEKPNFNLIFNVFRRNLK